MQNPKVLDPARAIAQGYGRSAHRRFAWFAAASALFIVDGANARVEVNVTRVGFPTLNRGDVIRSGCWTPITADIALLNQPAFDGIVRTAQLDTDGDAGFDSVALHLRAETGGSQHVVMYTVANPVRGRGRFTIELMTEDGETIELVSQGELTFQAGPAAQPNVISDDELLILSISNGTIGRIRELTDADRREVYTRPVNVAHISPEELPELWIGLESVDYAVWDDARPEDLTNRQLNALLTWVRMGGTLLVASSHGAGSIKLTETLYDVLPVTIGELVSVDNLPDARRMLLGAPTVEGDIRKKRDEDGTDWYDQPFPARVGAVRSSPRDGARVIVDAPSIGSALMTRQSVGRGSIIFSGVTLRDLFSGEGEAVDFFHKVFHLNVKQDPDVAPPQPVSLFQSVVSAIAFSTSSNAYLLAASIFSIGYLLCSTLGTWWFLGKRRWRQHSWSAFALVALVASVLSVMTVGMVRGLEDTLHQISIIDLDSGQRYGHATTFFGLKTSTDRELDVWLPSDPTAAINPQVTDCFLRPIPAGNDILSSNSSFADPETYRLVPASALVEDVRIRATLKRFEGRWQGTLGGTVSGKITVRGNQIHESSFVRNELGVPLTGCWLLHTVQDIAETKSKGYRSTSIYAFGLGDLPGDGSTIGLSDRCYPIAEGKSFAQQLEDSTLDSAQGAWLSRLDSVLAELGFGTDATTRAALGEEQRALLLLSTIGEFEPARHSSVLDWRSGGRTWSRDRLRHLDLREHLRRDTAILIGFAEDAGPVRLFRRSGDRRFRPLQPEAEKSWTMYRVFIPVTLLDGPQSEIWSDDAGHLSEH